MLTTQMVAWRGAREVGRVGFALRFCRRVVVRMGLWDSSGALRPRPRTVRSSVSVSVSFPFPPSPSSISTSSSSSSISTSSSLSAYFRSSRFESRCSLFRFVAIAASSSSGGKWLTQHEHRSSTRPRLGRVSA